ncbi:hypothetical protein [Micromonospora sp. MA102]|uniref:hypothetical protein n=1 Tax=Micromonospora sp. MA102 TaxID=2952755 RepID=UPI0021C7C795|nr:hypothetical protein [Micromonospora sp. MA102]
MRYTVVPAVVLRPVMARVRRTVFVDGAPQLRDEWERRVRRTLLVGEDGRPVLVAAGDQLGKVPVALLRLWCADRRDAL